MLRRSSTAPASAGAPPISGCRPADAPPSSTTSRSGRLRSGSSPARDPARGPRDRLRLVHVQRAHGSRVVRVPESVYGLHAGDARLHEPHLLRRVLHHVIDLVVEVADVAAS